MALEETGTAQVSLANRADLFRLVAFLDRLLPEENDIHSFLLTSLVPRNTPQSVYYVSGTDDYKAILAITEEKAYSALNQQMVDSWIMCYWATDESALINVFGAMDAIVDWECDQFYLYGRTQEPHPFIASRLTRPLRCIPINRFVLDVSTALDIQIRSRDDVYVKSLENCDAQIVFDLWPFKSFTTVQDVEDELARLPSAGVYLKSTDQLVAWMNLHPPNGMSRLHTLEEHRRKGYATLLTQYLSKRMAQAGHLPYAHVSVGNTASEQVFIQLGFRWQRSLFLHTT